MSDYERMDSLIDTYAHQKAEVSALARELRHRRRAARVLGRYAGALIAAESGYNMESRFRVKSRPGITYIPRYYLPDLTAKAWTNRLPGGRYGQHWTAWCTYWSTADKRNYATVITSASLLHGTAMAISA